MLGRIRETLKGDLLALLNRTLFRGSISPRIPLILSPNGSGRVLSGLGRLGLRVLGYRVADIRFLEALVMFAV